MQPDRVHGSDADACHVHSTGHARHESQRVCSWSSHFHSLLSFLSPPSLSALPSITCRFRIVGKEAIAQVQHSVVCCFLKHAIKGPVTFLPMYFNI